MQSKKVTYDYQRRSIVEDLVDIMDLTTTDQYTLYDMDQNKDLQDAVLELIPRIREAYNCNNFKAITDTERIKRPWLSIIKTILKPHYTITTQDYHFKQNNKYIHTKKYTFSKISENTDL